MMTIKTLTQKIRELLGPEAFFSNLFLKNHLCIAVYKPSDISLWSSQYAGHIELDFSGKVLMLSTEIESLNIVGSKIDLNSFETYWERDIYDRAYGVGDAVLLGTVNKSGKAVLFKAETAKNIVFRQQYETNGGRMADHDGYENARAFKKILKSKRLLEFRAFDHSGMIVYKTCYKEKGFIITADLTQFFGYELTLRVFKGRKRILTLKNAEDIQNLDKILTEIKSNAPSSYTKGLMLFDHWKINVVEMTNDHENPSLVNALVRFTGDKAPSGLVNFKVDFGKKTLRSDNRRSRIFVPKIESELRERLRA